MKATQMACVGGLAPHYCPLCPDYTGTKTAPFFFVGKSIVPFAVVACSRSQKVGHLGSVLSAALWKTLAGPLKAFNWA